MDKQQFNKLANCFVAKLEPLPPSMHHHRGMYLYTLVDLFLASNSGISSSEKHFCEGFLGNLLTKAKYLSGRHNRKRYYKVHFKNPKDNSPLYFIDQGATIIQNSGSIVEIPNGCTTQHRVTEDVRPEAMLIDETQCGVAELMSQVEFNKIESEVVELQVCIVEEVRSANKQVDMSQPDKAHLSTTDAKSVRDKILDEGSQCVVLPSKIAPSAMKLTQRLQGDESNDKCTR